MGYIKTMLGCNFVGYSYKANLDKDSNECLGSILILESINIKTKTTMKMKISCTKEYYMNFNPYILKLYMGKVITRVRKGFNLAEPGEGGSILIAISFQEEDSSINNQCIIQVERGLIEVEVT